VLDLRAPAHGEKSIAATPAAPVPQDALERVSKRWFNLAPDQLAPHVREGVVRLIEEDPVSAPCLPRPSRPFLSSFFNGQVRRHRRHRRLSTPDQRKCTWRDGQFPAAWQSEAGALLGLMCCLSCPTPLSLEAVRGPCAALLGFALHPGGVLVGERAGT
jgi:hypothetical protein